MVTSACLMLNLCSTSLQILGIVRTIRFLVQLDDQEWCVGEQIVHLLKWQSCGFWQEQVEEQGVGKVADDEEEVVFVPNVAHCDIGDLADESVEGEGNHGSDRHTL